MVHALRHARRLGRFRHGMNGFQQSRQPVGFRQTFLRQMGAAIARVQEPQSTIRPKDRVEMYRRGIQIGSELIGDPFLVPSGANPFIRFLPIGHLQKRDMKTVERVAGFVARDDLLRVEREFVLPRCREPGHQHDRNDGDRQSRAQVNVDRFAAAVHAGLQRMRAYTTTDALISRECALTEYDFAHETETCAPMTPSARLQSVIDILQGLDATAQPVDRFLHDWFRARRYAGSKDRAAVAERTYAILRHRSSFAWRMGSNDARALVIASLLAEGVSADAIESPFDGKAYGPAVLSEGERRALSSPPQGEPPLCVRGEFPPFLEAELAGAFGPALLDEMMALQTRAPVDLRVNTLKASRETVLGALRAEGYDAEATRYSPFAIRLSSGAGSAKLTPRRCSRPGHSSFRTRPRRSPRCCAPRGRGCACWISRPARAANPWPWRR